MTKNLVGDIYSRLLVKSRAVDHIIPLSRGGDNTLANVAPACSSCNSSKGNKSLDEFITYMNTRGEKE